MGIRLGGHWLKAAIVAVLAIGVLAASSAGASAATPSITSVTQTDRHVRVQWTLPPGWLSYAVEMSSGAAKDSYGYYADPYLPGSGLLGDEYTGTTDTDVETAVQVDPGHYFVHVITYDNTVCPTCPDVITPDSEITVPAAAPPPPPPPPVVHQKTTVKKKPKPAAKKKCPKGKKRKGKRCVKKKKAHHSRYRSTAATASYTARRLTPVSRAISATVNTP